SNPTITAGQSVTFTATVSAASGPAPTTGTVSFRDGGLEIGTGNVGAGGVATFTTSTLAAGSHPITAVFLAQTGFNTSTSTTATEALNPVATPRSLAPGSPTATVGQSVTFTATVSAVIGPAPTAGTVSFRDNGAQIGTGNVSGGVATFTTSALTVGTHPITAVFLPATGAGFNTSTSNTVS